MARTSSGARRATASPQRLTSIQNAAIYSDVSSRTIRRWIAAGLLPGYRVGPRLVNVSLNELDQLARRIPTVRMDTG